jgi:cytochrome c oxidase assembly factor CtaG
MAGSWAPLATGGLAPALSPLLLAAYAVPYARRARTLARRGRPVPTWRLWCFGAGLVLLLLAVSPPVDVLANDRFAWHMAEHLLIGDLAPLLVVLGLTGPLLAPVLRIGFVDRLRVLTHPVLAFALWAVDLYFWHLPFAYQAALRHDAIHVLEHACFFVFGLNLWMPLFGPLPRPAWFGNGAALGYVVVVRLTGTVLANVFVWAGGVVYPYYGTPAHGALGDQAGAGSIMMVEQSLLTLCLFCWLFLKTARDAEERDRLKELADSRGVPLDDRRAARAVAAGHGEALRRRILGEGVSPPRPGAPAP